AAQNPALSQQLGPQSHTYFVHARARIAGTCDFKYRIAHFELLPERKLIQRQAACRDVLFNLPWSQSKGLQSLNVHQQYLTAPACPIVAGTLEARVRNRRNALQFSRRLP